MSLEEMKKQYEIGSKILEQIFQLSDVEIKEKLKSICGNKTPEYAQDLFEKDSAVERVIKNEKPYSISIYCYNSIEIGAFGISFKPEHGEGCSLVDFNEHFKL